VGRERNQKKGEIKRALISTTGNLEKDISSSMVSFHGILDERTCNNVEAMTQLASHGREKNCRIDFSEENGVVTEMYVW